MQVSSSIIQHDIPRLPRGVRGASFENPFPSLVAESNPNAEMFVVLDPSRGYIRTVANEARNYRATGYAVFDVFGNRVTDFDEDLVAALHRLPPRDAFVEQYEEIYDIEDQIMAMNEAHLDEEIFYDAVNKRFKRRKIVTAKVPHTTARKDEPSIGALAASSDPG